MSTGELPLPMRFDIDGTARCRSFDTKLVYANDAKAGDTVLLTCLVPGCRGNINSSPVPPRRPRIEKMAESAARADGAAGNTYFVAERTQHYTEAIRAVCYYLRQSGPADASDIEREFLEPR